MKTMNKGRNQKKRYGLLLTLLVLSWIFLGWMVWRVDPDNIKNFIVPGIYLPMLVTIFGALFLLFSVLLLSAQRALLWAGGLTFFIMLRFLGLGSTLNGVLIMGLLFSVEIYNFRFKYKKDEASESKEVVEL
jgi:hypothetical protein